MEYFRRLYRFWFPCGLHGLLWLFLAFAPIFFFQTTIHEGSHSLANAIAGDGFANFAPFPHFNRAFNSNLMGVTDTEGNDFNAMPQIVTILLIVGVALTCIFARIRNCSARFFLHVIFLGMCVDLIYNTAKGLAAAAGPMTDWGRFSAQIGVGWTTFLAWLFWLIMFSYFVWVYFSAWHRVDGEHGWPENRGFWDFRLICMILLVISAIAIPVFLGVNDPNIVKGGFWFFYLLLVLHFIMVIWGIVYMIMASIHRGRVL